ncbi:RNA pseudouridylate synthase domain-containing protein 2 [Brienomyrus brachyistius]|uniref:RNA pseudouridylate synthase domain-containing protein 2 n=1 Tax=Brienomyrus brachyistius TaxID=42636 RepID=UPI0020B1C1AB|nr:RNA pseudouridylate synthase domain-containing protein 2 [Brienomyrus brachyistius]
MWFSLVEAASVFSVNYAKKAARRLLYNRVRNNRSTVITEAIGADTSQVSCIKAIESLGRRMINPKRGLTTCCNILGSGWRIGQLYIGGHSGFRSGGMESNEVPKALSESNAEPEHTGSSLSVKESGEKRKSDETDEPGKNGRGKRRRGGGGKNLRPGERYVPPPQKLNPGVSFGEEHFRETTYYFEGGLRKVHPYYFDFKTYCKGRWIGKTLMEVFSSEFRAESLDYYKQAALQGRIRLNETLVDDLNITLKNNDFLRNTVHRHEPPVSSQPLEILEDNGEVLVVDKPSSLPVHPCGRFRHNTVIFILGKEFGVCGLHTVHRLDRLTSGVLLFARTLEVSKKLDQFVRDRQVEKEYVCRVTGEFPDGELVCEEPILVVSFKVGVCRVDPKGKPCRTVFQRLSWNGRSSVVRCQPLTGRTHQIRVHLQFLGYPIVNDPIYGSDAWGPHRAKGGLLGKTDEELLQALVEEHRSKESLHLLDLPGEVLPTGKSVEQLPDPGCGIRDGSSATLPPDNDLCGKSDALNTCNVKEPSKGCSDSNSPDFDSHDQKKAEDGSVNTGLPACQLNGGSSATAVSVDTLPTACIAENEMAALAKEPATLGPAEPARDSSPVESLSTVKDPLCSECKIVRADPTEKELIMYLHALRYKGPDFEFSTRLPDWAREDWEQD